MSSAWLPNVPSTPPCSASPSHRSANESTVARTTTARGPGAAERTNRTPGAARSEKSTLATTPASRTA